jgi:hypothetical protein
MVSEINLWVYRRLDNRFEGLSDDSPRALELHNRRKLALQDVLCGEKSIEVLSWGDTDDKQSHESVELILIPLTTVFTYAIVPGLKYVGEKLAEKAIDYGASEIAKWLISKLRPQQESKKILNFGITLPDGTNILVDPPNRDGMEGMAPIGNADIRIIFKDGTVSSFTYTTPGTS